MPMVNSVKPYLCCKSVFTYYIDMFIKNIFTYYIETGNYGELSTQSTALYTQTVCKAQMLSAIFKSKANELEGKKQMSYSLNDQRKQTMLQRLGDAAQLIDDQRFLPFYRSIQIKLEKMGKPEEWAHMIEAALKAEKPSRYFSKLCKMVKDGSYHFVEKVKEVQADLRLYVHDKLIKYNFGKFQKYWVRKAQQFINVNGQSGFVELLEYAERKGISQRQMATALKNCKAPRQYYQENVLGAAK